MSLTTSGIKVPGTTLLTVQAKVNSTRTPYLYLRKTSQSLANPSRKWEPRDRQVLNRIERVQRMHKGQPVSPQVDVKIS